MLPPLYPLTSDLRMYISVPCEHELQFMHPASVPKFWFRLRVNIFMPLQPSVGPRPLLQFLDPIHSRQDSLDGGSARRKAATYTQNKRTQTSMPLVGFEPTIPALERAKTVHALELAATVIGYCA
jgi:hypothetical protein